MHAADVVTLNDVLEGYDCIDLLKVRAFAFPLYILHMSISPGADGSCPVCKLHACFSVFMQMLGKPHLDA